MGLEAEGRVGAKEKEEIEEKEEQIMCERIGHRPLRGRCPKRNARGKKRKNDRKGRKNGRTKRFDIQTDRQIDRKTHRNTEERLHDL